VAKNTKVKQHFNIKNQFGYLDAVFADGQEDYDILLGAISETTSFDDHAINALFHYLEDVDMSVSMASRIHVHQEYRGQGHGAEMMKKYLKEFELKTDIDILFARVDTPQNNGLSLIGFYQQLGYNPVHKSNGDFLMVTKGHELGIKNLLNLPQMRSRREEGFSY
jgi:GNAT superfamily N-acetyltransferase